VCVCVCVLIMRMGSRQLRGMWQLNEKCVKML